MPNLTYFLSSFLIFGFILHLPPTLKEAGLIRADLGEVGQKGSDQRPG